MGAREDWDAAVSRLRSLPRDRRWASADFGEIYALALDVAPSLLRGFRLDNTAPADLAGDLLSSDKLHALVEKDYAYFVASLRNKAIDRLRKLKKTSAEVPPEAVGAAQAEGGRRVEAREALSRLNAVEREIFCALASGEEAVEIGRRFGKSRDAVYQIVCRARERLGPRERS